MRTTTLKNVAFSVMLVGSIGLTSCDKNDDLKPTPNEVQQHFVFVHSNSALGVIYSQREIRYLCPKGNSEIRYTSLQEGCTASCKKQVR